MIFKHNISHRGYLFRSEKNANSARVLLAADSAFGDYRFVSLNKTGPEKHIKFFCSLES